MRCGCHGSDRIGVGRCGVDWFAVELSGLDLNGLDWNGAHVFGLVCVRACVRVIVFECGWVAHICVRVCAYIYMYI